MTDKNEYVDKATGRLLSRKAPAGSFGDLLEGRKKQVAELRPDLATEEFAAALGYVNTFLGYYELDQILTLVDAIREARSRLGYLTDAEFTELRKMVQTSGDPSCLADELVRGIEALRPRSPVRRKPGAPRMSYEDREKQLRAALDRIADSPDVPTQEVIAEALGREPRTLRRWLSDYPELERLMPAQDEPASSRHKR